MSQVIYQGIFFNDEAIITMANNPLSNVVKNMHITFSFKPTVLFPKEVVGQRFDIKVIGEGCDGQNHGFLVEIPEELKRYYKGSKQPHITVSLADGAKAVNTSNIEFKTIEPFTISGRVGFYTKDKVAYQI